jgi:hypothetical protein
MLEVNESPKLDLDKYTQLRTIAEVLMFCARFESIDKVPGTVSRWIHPDTFEPLLVIDLIDGERYYYTMATAQRAKARHDRGNNNRQTA